MNPTTTLKGLIDRLITPKYANAFLDNEDRWPDLVDAILALSPDSGFGPDHPDFSDLCDYAETVAERHQSQFWATSHELFRQAGFNQSFTNDYSVEAWVVACDLTESDGSTRLLILDPEDDDPSTQYQMCLHCEDERVGGFWHTLGKASNIDEVKALIERAVALRERLGFKFDSLTEMYRADKYGADA